VQADDVAVPSRFGDIASMVLADSADGALIPGTVHPSYPSEERSRGIQAAFAMAFVLDESGTPEYQSVSFIGYPPPAFLTVGCDMMRTARYRPVVRDGKPVRALLVADWTFSLYKEGREYAEHGPFMNVKRLRREFAEKGLVRVVQDLEARRHCE
jgi:hypothetical protein